MASSKLILRWLEGKSIEDTKDHIGEFTAGRVVVQREGADQSSSRINSGGAGDPRSNASKTRHAQAAKVLVCAFAWAGPSLATP